jgi:hypothetical protein
MESKLTNGMKMWKENRDTTTLSFSLKGLEIYIKKEDDMNTTVKEHFNSILFRKSGHAKKQHTYQSINQ